MESKQQLLEIISKEAQDRAQYLANLFRYIPEAIAKEMIYTKVKKNESLLVAGKPSKTVYIILQGHVIGMDYKKMGQVYSFMDFTKMYIVGDFEIFTDCSDYCVSIYTTQECKLLKISSSSYLYWIQHDENALYLRLKNILQTITFERKIDREYLFMTCQERLENFLLMFYETNQNTSLKTVKVNISQGELADKIGVNIRSLQRSIKSLEEKELISNEHGKISISYEQYLKLEQCLKKKEERNRYGKI